jgi:hypothetical protein
MNDKLEAAIAYLRGRNKYVTDAGCNFVPTSRPTLARLCVRIAGTSNPISLVKGCETVRTYRREVEQSNPISLVKGKK